MKRKPRIVVLGILMALLYTGAVAAEDVSIGQLEYTNSCANCHGADGKGNGPYTELLKVAVPDLTSLQANNKGVFPFQRVYEVIDGRAEVVGHGPRDMPIWGKRYMKDAIRMETMGDYALHGEEYVRSRILALIAYLSTLQQ